MFSCSHQRSTAAIVASLAVSLGACARVDVQNNTTFALCDVSLATALNTLSMGRIEPAQTGGATSGSTDMARGTLCVRPCDQVEQVCGPVDVHIVEFHTSRLFVEPGAGPAVRSESWRSPDSVRLYLDRGNVR